MIQQNRSQGYTKKMLGLGKELWKGVDPLEYIRKEREEWGKKYGRYSDGRPKKRN